MTANRPTPRLVGALHKWRACSRSEGKADHTCPFEDCEVELALAFKASQPDDTWECKHGQPLGQCTVDGCTWAADGDYAKLASTLSSASETDDDFRSALEDIQRACVTHIDKGEGDPTAFAAWVRRRAESALGAADIQESDA